MFCIPDFPSYVCIACQNFDGNGKEEKEVKGQYTSEDCIDIVKKDHPDANGATSEGDNCDDNKCACKAVFGMTKWKRRKPGPVAKKTCMWSTRT